MVETVGTDKKTIRAFFEHRSRVEQYQAHEDYNLSSRRRVVFDMLEGMQFNKVVDLGCGSGGYLDIRDKYDCVYFGLDASENMIEAARDRAGELGIEGGVYLQMGDVEGTPYVNGFCDLVLAIGLFEYFQKPDRLIGEIKRILKQGGVLIVQSFIPNSYVYSIMSILVPIKDAIMGKRNTIERRKYTKEQLDRLLADNGFKLADFAYSNFYLLPTTPLDRWFQGIHIRLSEYLAGKSLGRFGCLAVNYIGKYRLEGTH